jgi:hypothetical protein
MEEQEFKWRLLWSGRKDTVAERAACEHLKTFPLWKDSEAKLITFEEYQELVKNDEIAPPQSHWQIEQGEVGYISLFHYARYTDTWCSIDMAHQDFLAGWYQCQRLQDIEIYEQALIEDKKWIDNLNKKAKRLIKEKHSERKWIRKESKALNIEYCRLLHEILTSLLIGVSEEDAIYIIDNWR